MEVIKNEYTKLMDGIKYVVAPRGCESYLTAGKVYRVLEYQRIGISAFFKIGCDEGFILNCCLTDCPHLNGQDWIIPEQLARKELPKPTISLDSPEFAKLTKDIVEHYVDIAAKEFQRRIDSGEIKMPEPSKPTTTYTSTSTIDIESLRNGLKLTKPTVRIIKLKT